MKLGLPEEPPLPPPLAPPLPLPLVPPLPALAPPLPLVPPPPLPQPSAPGRAGRAPVAQRGAPGRASRAPVTRRARPVRVGARLIGVSFASAAAAPYNGRRGSREQRAGPGAAQRLRPRSGPQLDVPQAGPLLGAAV